MKILFIVILGLLLLAIGNTSVKIPPPDDT